MSRLALRGGPPAVPAGTVPTAWPLVTEEDIAAIVAVLRRGGFTVLSPGEEHVAALEREFAERVGTRYGIAVNSGTAALHLALAAAGIGPGDEVIVPALSFVATAMAVLHSLAVPVFADIDAHTFNLDPRDVATRITPATRAVIAVHLHGLPADMAELRTLAAEHRLLLVEDAAQAYGAIYRGRRTGALGDVAATSFNVSKNLPTCGEGGLLTTDREDLVEEARMRRQFGERITPDGGRVYVSQRLGWNYKLNVIQAAFVRSQLRRIDALTEERQRHFHRFSRVLAQLPGLRPPAVLGDRTHVFHFFRFRLDPAGAGYDVSAAAFRRAVHRALLAEGVSVGTYQSLPLPGHPVFQERDGFGRGVPWSLATRPLTYRPEEYPVALQVLKDSLVLHRGLLGPEAGRVLEVYARAFEKVWDHLDEIVEYGRGLSASRVRPAARTSAAR